MPVSKDSSKRHYEFRYSTLWGEEECIHVKLTVNDRKVDLCPECTVGFMKKAISCYEEDENDVHEILA
jgi:hypothetical protein